MTQVYGRGQSADSFNDKQPAYDTNAEHTTMAAADVLYEVMSMMVKKGPLSNMIEEEAIGDL